MKLKKDDQVKFTIWVNDSIISDPNAEVFTADEGEDTLFVYLKNENGTEVKIKIAKTHEIEE